MNQDQQTYQRAVGVTLAGLVIQIIFAVAILVLALSTEAPYSAVALMYHTIGGVLLWIALAVVFYQHRLERIESLETEQIAERQGRQSSIFETAVDELSVARRRLEKMYRWLLPITSIITSAYLIAIGVWQFRRWLSANADVRSFEGVLSAGNPLVSNTPEGQVALIGLAACGALAFVGFIFSRYVAGMAKTDTLGLLRGECGLLHYHHLLREALGDLGALCLLCVSDRRQCGHKLFLAAVLCLEVLTFELAQLCKPIGTLGGKCRLGLGLAPRSAWASY